MEAWQRTRDYLFILRRELGVFETKHIHVYEISMISNRQVETIKRNQFRKHFQERLEHPWAARTPAQSRVARGAPGCWVRAPSSRHAHRTSPVTQRTPPHIHTAYAILPSRGFQIAPVTFVGDKGKRCPPRLSWGSSLPAPAAVCGAANYRKERGRKRAAAPARPTPTHPALRRPRPHSAQDAPARPQGRVRGNPAPVRPSPRRVTVGSDGDPHCDRSTPGRRPLPYPRGTRDPTQGSQAALGKQRRLPGAQTSSG